jgi:hypothetical protein
MWFVNACSEAAEEDVKEVRQKRKAIMKGGQSKFLNAGSWDCPQCFRNNFAPRLWCLGCKLHRQTEREKDVHAADQGKWCEYETRKAANAEEWKAEKRKKSGEMEAAATLKVCVQIRVRGLDIFPSLFFENIFLSLRYSLTRLPVYDTIVVVYIKIGRGQVFFLQIFLSVDQMITN